LRRIGLVGAAIMIGLLALVASAPSSDADSPEWMEPMVDAGRASLLEHLDLIDPGSPLILVSAHCRSDGAVRLIYENRWLWLVDRQYYAEAAPGWVSGSMGGGVLHASDDWLTSHSEVSCANRPPTSLPQQCVGDVFSIGFPEGWWVHPADAKLGIEPCSFFAVEPFGAEREEDDFGLSGAQVSIWTGSGCRGSFDVAIAERQLAIDGRRAFRHELERGEGGPQPLALQYLVRLAGGVPCETSSWLVARTESDDPGDHAENRRILDLMLQSLDLDARGG
jgi:hypothetical protein